MTVSYTGQVATATLGTLLRLLFRWKASLYKLIWKETIIFVIVYGIIAIISQHALPCPAQLYFASWVKFCNKSTSIIPLAFVLSVFVSLIISRWWEILMSIASPARACYYVSTCIPGDDQESLKYRRAIARRLNLAQLLVLRDVSTAVKRRFPTLNQVVSSGFMTPEERDLIETMNSDTVLSKYNKYWVVIKWASNVYARALKDDLINHSVFAAAFEQLIFSRHLGKDADVRLGQYSFGLFAIVYGYFMNSLIGSQYIDDMKMCSNSTTFGYDHNSNNDYRHIERYMPIYPVLEFVFYMGWLKVAVSIMNPLGEDDDDFEINDSIDENLAISYGIVDSYHDSCPDKDETRPILQPSRIKSKSHQGSAVSYNPSGIQ